MWCFDLDLNWSWFDSFDFNWSRLRGKRLLSFNHCFDSIVHVLNKANLTHTQSSLVAYVIDVVIELCVLTMSSSNLDVVLGSDSFKFILDLAQMGKVNVNRCSQSSTKVSRAAGDVTKVVIVCEFCNL